MQIRKEAPDQRYMDGIWFDIAEKEDITAKLDQEDMAAFEAFKRKQSELRESLNASGFGSAEDYRNMPYLSAYIPAPKLEKYTITMSRANDRIVVNKDYPIELNPK